MWDGGFARGEGNGWRWWRNFAGLRRFELVAGEETRSRETGENAEVAARHLVPFRAALRAGDPVGAGCGDDGEFHGPFCLLR
jgi:hypothetical protein